MGKFGTTPIPVPRIPVPYRTHPCKIHSTETTRVFIHVRIETLCHRRREDEHTLPGPVPKTHDHDYVGTTTGAVRRHHQVLGLAFLTFPRHPSSPAHQPTPTHQRATAAKPCSRHYTATLYRVKSRRCSSHSAKDRQLNLTLTRTLQQYLRPEHLCCTAHKKMSFRRFFAQIYDWRHLYLCIFLARHPVTLPQLQPHDPKMHHPGMDSSVFSLQCGQATAVFVRSMHRDIVAQV